MDKEVGGVAICTWLEGREVASALYGIREARDYFMIEDEELDRFIDLYHKLKARYQRVKYPGESMDLG